MYYSTFTNFNYFNIVIHFFQKQALTVRPYDSNNERNHYAKILNFKNKESERDNYKGPWKSNHQDYHKYLYQFNRKNDEKEKNKLSERQYKVDSENKNYLKPHTGVTDNKFDNYYLIRYNNEAVDKERNTNNQENYGKNHHNYPQPPVESDSDNLSRNGFHYNNEHTRQSFRRPQVFFNDRQDLILDEPWGRGDIYNIITIVSI